MCTITFIPSGNTVIITSNRDEKYSRPQAIEPEAYQFLGGTIYYPKDTQAGGTWFAVHENGNVVVLMNGAFANHSFTPPYKYSRGLVVLKLIQQKRPFEEFKLIDLMQIEPFTVIIWEEEKLYECRWDGNKKHLRSLNVLQPYIWSSATLYSNEAIQKRQEWFSDWLIQNSNPEQEGILKFHQFTGDDDVRNTILMNRDNEYCTVSIISIVLHDSFGGINYFDTKNTRTSTLNFDLKKECAHR